MAYNFCDECGQWDMVGYMECKQKYLCPNCASKVFNTDPESIRAGLVLKQLIDEMNIGYACRALLGDGKGKSVMLRWLHENPAYYAELMGKARNKLEVQGVKLPKL